MHIASNYRINILFFLNFGFGILKSNKLEDIRIKRGIVDLLFSRPLFNLQKKDQTILWIMCGYLFCYYNDANDTNDSISKKEMGPYNHIPLKIKRN
jgi:hypothetical protein